MKTVFSNTDLFHTFAQRSQPHGRAGSAFFKGDKCYSYGYHYLLAEFITNKDGETAVMINNKGYSVTTRKHISYITAATRQYRQFYTEQTDAARVLEQLEELLAKLPKARKPEKYIHEAQSLINSYNEFLTWSKGKPTKEIKAISKYFDGSGLDASEYAKKKAAAKKAAAKKAFQDQYKKFLNFEGYRISHNEFNNEDYLRISPAGHYVETSQGVTINPVSAALLYKMIKAGKPVHGYNIDGFTVTGLNGVLSVGCHKINRKNMEETGEKLLKLGY